MRRYSDAKRLMAVLALASGALAVCIPIASAAGAVVSGTVMDRARNPIRGARVVAEMVGSLDTRHPLLADPVSVQYRGPHREFLTGSDGRYAVNLPVPAGIPPKHLYVQVTVVKPVGKPAIIYGMQRKALSLREGFTKQLDFFLEPMAYGALISGTIRDQDAGERLPSVRVEVRAQNGPLVELETNADGQYVGVIPLQAKTQTVTLWVGRRPYGAAGGGIPTVSQELRLTLNSGVHHVQDVTLQRDLSRAVVVGRLIDGVSGAPLRNALVEIRQSPSSWHFGTTNFTVRKYALTDFLGRYAAPIEMPVDLQIETAGALLHPTDISASPYHSQQVDLSGRLVDGQVFVQDFSLVPQPPVVEVVPGPAPPSQLPGHDAAFVMQGVPTTLKPGQLAEASIVMWNTGTTTWEANAQTFTQYYLGFLPQGSSTFGPSRRTVGPVRPGQWVEVVMAITAPLRSGTYNFQWRMFQERTGVGEGFGQATPNIRITVQ